MKIIFCDNLLEPSGPDADFEAEYGAAKSAGLETGLISYEELLAGDAERAVRRVKASVNEQWAIYRGWMLKPAQYGELYNALRKRNLMLINSPEEYAHAHYFPNAYPLIAARTPRSVYFKVEGEVNYDQIAEALVVFGDQAVIVKDFVKSEKHHWQEACFIPSAANRDQVEKITRRFLELRGTFLNEGLVYRAFVQLDSLANHSKSSMPLAREFRLFFLDGQLLAHFNYWEEGNYGEEAPEWQSFAGVAKTIRSRFFTMDIAKTVHGEWLIIELGDGQVSSLPEQADLNEFYHQLKSKLPVEY